MPFVRGALHLISGEAGRSVHRVPWLCSLGEASYVAASLKRWLSASCPGLGDRTVCRPQKGLTGSMVLIYASTPSQLFRVKLRGPHPAVHSLTSEAVLVSFPSYRDPCFWWVLRLVAAFRNLRDHSATRAAVSHTGWQLAAVPCRGSRHASCGSPSLMAASGAALAYTAQARDRPVSLC